MKKTAKQKSFVMLY